MSAFVGVVVGVVVTVVVVGAMNWCCCGWRWLLPLLAQPESSSQESDKPTWLRPGEENKNTQVINQIFHVMLPYSLVQKFFNSHSHSLKQQLVWRYGNMAHLARLKPVMINYMELRMKPIFNLLHQAPWSRWLSGLRKFWVKIYKDASKSLEQPCLPLQWLVQR